MLHKSLVDNSSFILNDFTIIIHELKRKLDKKGIKTLNLNLRTFCQSLSPIEAFLLKNSIYSRSLLNNNGSCLNVSNILGHEVYQKFGQNSKNVLNTKFFEIFANFSFNLRPFFISKLRIFLFRFGRFQYSKPRSESKCSQKWH